jgi:hypothetical protein
MGGKIKLAAWVLADPYIPRMRGDGLQGLGASLQSKSIIKYRTDT